MEPRVSVVICTYNGADYIGPQLSSILDQSILPGEIVFSDDASSDNTVEIVRDILRSAKKNNPEIANVSKRFLLREENIGLVRNFEEAIAESTRPIVFLSDQDDVWVSTKIESMLAAFDSNPAVSLIHSNATLIDSSGKTIGTSLYDVAGLRGHRLAMAQRGEHFNLFLTRNFVTGATVALRRELYDSARPFPESWIHDEWLAMLASLESGILTLSQELIGYRQHENNQIGAKPLNFSNKLQKLLLPRSLRNRQLLARSLALKAFAEESLSDVSQQSLAIRSKYEFELVRSSLPVSRLLRVAGILREVQKGSYNRFGNGLPDALRDLVQPGGSRRR